MAGSEAVAPSPEPSGVGRAVLLTAVVHGLALIGLMALLVVVVPRYEETFRNARMSLPAATCMAISASVLAKSYGVLLLPVLLAADVAVYALLRRQAGTKTLSTVWSVAALLVLLVCAGLVILAIQLPFAAGVSQPGGQG